MKTLLLSLLLLSPSAHAESFELSSIAGLPNSSQDFVARILKRSVSFVSGANELDYSTGLFYFAERNGTQNAQAIQVINERGNGTLLDLNRAIDLAAATSKVVLIPIGGGSQNQICERAAATPRTVFLFSANALNEQSENGPCRAKNLLFVTALNAALDDAGEYSKTGALVRLAVPSMNLKAPVEGTRSISLHSLGFGMAMAAGKISETSRAYPQLWGSALIDRFLNTKTDTLASLRGKVVGERALLHSNQ
jgi:hypothetical protein